MRVRQESEAVRSSCLFYSPYKQISICPQPVDQVDSQAPIGLIEKPVLKQRIVAKNHVSSLTQVADNHHTERLHCVCLGKLVVMVQVDPAMLAGFSQCRNMVDSASQGPATVNRKAFKSCGQWMNRKFANLEIKGLPSIATPSSCSVPLATSTSNCRRRLRVGCGICSMTARPPPLLTKLRTACNKTIRLHSAFDPQSK